MEESRLKNPAVLIVIALLALYIGFTVGKSSYNSGVEELKEKNKVLTQENTVLLDRVKQMGNFINKTNDIINEVSDGSINKKFLALGYKYVNMDTAGASTKPSKAIQK